MLQYNFAFIASFGLEHFATQKIDVENFYA